MEATSSINPLTEVSEETAQDQKRGHEQEGQSPKLHTSQGSKDPSNPPLSAGEEPPPLPSDEAPPPLPDEAPPGQVSEDDGWEPVWDDTTQAYYFYNRITNVTQWENPRVAAGVTDSAAESETGARPYGGYDPAIHGDYDPTASYAIEAREREEAQKAAAAAAAAVSTTMPDYSAAGHFNRFTGKWQAEAERSQNYSDEAKSARQMNAFFDVDAAANLHDGKSLKAERANKKLTKKELKAFKDKRKEKKEEKRRAWLRD